MWYHLLVRTLKPNSDSASLLYTFSEDDPCDASESPKIPTMMYGEFEQSTTIQTYKSTEL